MNELKIFGKVIGEFSGWEQLDTLIFQFIDVTFNDEGRKIFDCDEANIVNVMYDDGIIKIYNYDKDRKKEYYVEFEAADLTFISDNKHHIIESDKDDEFIVDEEFPTDSSDDELHNELDD